MWSGRFDNEVDPEFDAWQRSFPYDRRLLAHEVAASKAYAAALARVGTLTSAELQAIISGLDQIAAEGIAGDDSSIEDVHHYVEARLQQKIGDAALKLHTGRSRNEQIATGLRLFVREQTGQLTLALHELIAALVDRAEAAGDAAMPAYTHSQQAEPVLVGHWLLAYAEMFLRDVERLRDCATRANECPLGSGAVAGTLLPLDRAKLSSDLGFDRPTVNSMDATSDRDFAIEFAQACSLLALHLSRMAEEFIVFASREYGFVRLPEAYSTGSSAMPQKKNPDALELLRGKAGRITGHLVALLMTVKGLPLAYNKDLQETQQPLYFTADESLTSVRIAARFIAAVEFDFPRMQAAAGSGHMNAFTAAAYLAEQGIPFRKAHELVGAAVREAIKRGVGLQELDAAQLSACGINAEITAFRHALSLQEVIASHDVPGGTASARVQAAIKSIRQKLAALEEAQHVHA